MPYGRTEGPSSGIDLLERRAIATRISDTNEIIRRAISVSSLINVKVTCSLGPYRLPERLHLALSFLRVIAELN